MPVARCATTGAAARAGVLAPGGGAGPTLTSSVPITTEGRGTSGRGGGTGGGGRKGASAPAEGARSTGCDDAVMAAGIGRGARSPGGITGVGGTGSRRIAAVGGGDSCARCGDVTGAACPVAVPERSVREPGSPRDSCRCARGAASGVFAGAGGATSEGGRADSARSASSEFAKIGFIAAGVVSRADPAEGCGAGFVEERPGSGATSGIPGLGNAGKDVAARGASDGASAMRRSVAAARGARRGAGRSRSTTSNDAGDGRRRSLGGAMRGAAGLALN
jgi:hypothetical protein